MTVRQADAPITDNDLRNAGIDSGRKDDVTNAVHAPPTL